MNKNLNFPCIKINIEYICFCEIILHVHKVLSNTCFLITLDVEIRRITRYCNFHQLSDFLTTGSSKSFRNKEVSVEKETRVLALLTAT